jgi:hypothetical protein
MPVKPWDRITDIEKFPDSEAGVNKNYVALD